MDCRFYHNASSAEHTELGIDHCNCHEMDFKMILLPLLQQKEVSLGALNILFGHDVFEELQFQNFEKISGPVLNIHCYFVCRNINILRDAECFLVYGAMCMWYNLVPCMMSHLL